MNQHPSIKICAVVLGRTLPEFLANLKKAQTQTKLIELRVDYIQDVKPADLETIQNAVDPSVETILTCRSQAEGGEYKGSEKERLTLLEAALRIGFTHVDIELSSIAQIDQSQKNPATKIICSYHNFEQTPPYSELKNIKQQMQSHQPDILKIATMVQRAPSEFNDPANDPHPLLRLLLNKKPTEKMAVIGMGEKGKLIRVLGPLLGSYLTFASIDQAASASGQLDIQELQEIYRQLKF